MWRVPGCEQWGVSGTMTEVLSVKWAGLWAVGCQWYYNGGIEC